MNFKKLLVIVFLLSPAAPNFAMESEKEIYEIIAEKVALDRTLYGDEDLQKELCEKYKEYEAKLSHGEKPTPKIDLPHRLDYAMTFDDMQTVIKNKFSEMEKKGLIIPKSQFEKIKNQYEMVPCYGASKIPAYDLLEQHINNSQALKGSYHILPYIIVVPDNTKQISAKITFYYQQMPMLYGLINNQDTDDSLRIYYKKNGANKLSPNSPEAQLIIDDLKKNEKGFLLHGSNITKDENGQCIISKPNLLTHLTSLNDDQSDDFTVYTYEKFCHVNTIKKFVCHKFPYDLTIDTSPQEPSSDANPTSQKIINNPKNKQNTDTQEKTKKEAPPNPHPKVTGNFFFDKLYELCSWAKQNKFPAFCVMSGTGVALYWTITFALGNKKIGLHSLLK